MVFSGVKKRAKRCVELIWNNQRNTAESSVISLFKASMMVLVTHGVGTSMFINDRPVGWI